MAAGLLRLTVALRVAGLRRGGRTAARVVSGAILTAAAGAAAAVLVSVGARLPRDADAVSVILTALLVGVCAVLPAARRHPDAPDVRLLAGLGLRPAAVGLLVPALASCSVAGVAVVVVSACLGAAAAVQGASAVQAVVTATLIALTALGAARVCAASTPPPVPGRRSGAPRIAVPVGAVLVGLLAAGLTVVAGGSSSLWAHRVLTTVSAVLRVTPLAAADAAASLRPDAAAILVASATVVMLVVAWAVVVRRALCPVTAAGVPSGPRVKAGPASPTLAVAVRTWRSRIRDPRFLVDASAVPVTVLIVIVPLVAVGLDVRDVSFWIAPLVALLVGWLAHNDLAYDASGLWMQTGAAVPGWVDRVGRLLAASTAGIPVTAAVAAVSLGATGRGELWPAVTGACAVLWLSALGLSAISSVAAAYPVARDPSHPFRQPQRTGPAAVIAPSAVLLGALVLSAPALWLSARATVGDAVAGWTVLTVGAGTGLVVVVLGVVVGGVLYDRGIHAVMGRVDAT